MGGVEGIGRRGGRGERVLYTQCTSPSSPLPHTSTHKGTAHSPSGNMASPGGFMHLLQT